MEIVQKRRRLVESRRSFSFVYIVIFTHLSCSNALPKNSGGSRSYGWSSHVVPHQNHGSSSHYTSGQFGQSANHHYPQQSSPVNHAYQPVQNHHQVPNNSPQVIVHHQVAPYKPGIGQLAKEAAVDASVRAGVNAVANRVIPGGIYGTGGFNHGSSSGQVNNNPPPDTNSIVYNNYYNNGDGMSPGNSPPVVPVQYSQFTRPITNSGSVNNLGSKFFILIITTLTTMKFIVF